MLYSWNPPSQYPGNTEPGIDVATLKEKCDRETNPPSLFPSLPQLQSLNLKPLGGGGVVSIDDIMVDDTGGGGGGNGNNGEDEPNNIAAKVNNKQMGFWLIFWIITYF